MLFSGDHVMAWNTSVVGPPEGRMSDYMRSLELLLDRDETLLLPGHGGPIEEPRRTVKAYLLHRKWREQAILEAVRKRHQHRARAVAGDLSRPRQGGRRCGDTVAAGPHRSPRGTGAYRLRQFFERRLRGRSSLTSFASSAASTRAAGTVNSITVTISLRITRTRTALRPRSCSP